MKLDTRCSHFEILILEILAFLFYIGHVTIIVPKILRYQVGFLTRRLILVTSSYRPPKIGGIEKTVAAFFLAAWCVLVDIYFQCFHLAECKMVGPNYL